MSIREKRCASQFSPAGFQLKERQQGQPRNRIEPFTQRAGSQENPRVQGEQHEQRRLEPQSRWRRAEGGHGDLGVNSRGRARDPA